MALQRFHEKKIHLTEKSLLTVGECLWPYTQNANILHAALIICNFKEWPNVQKQLRSPEEKLDNSYACREQNNFCLSAIAAMVFADYPCKTNKRIISIKHTRTPQENQRYCVREYKAKP